MDNRKSTTSASPTSILISQHHPDFLGAGPPHRRFVLPDVLLLLS
jgi:hypothetical protein